MHVTIVKQNIFEENPRWSFKKTEVKGNNELPVTLYTFQSLLFHAFDKFFKKYHIKYFLGGKLETNGKWDFPLLDILQILQKVSNYEPKKNLAKIVSMHVNLQYYSIPRYYAFDDKPKL